MRISHRPGALPAPDPAFPAPLTLEELLARQRLARQMRDEAIASLLRRGWRLVCRLLEGPREGRTSLPPLRADRL